MKRADPRKQMRHVVLDVSVEDVELVREQGECLVSSYQYGGRRGGVPDHKQPTEWHEGQTMLALAKRMQTAYRKAKT